MIVGYSPVRKYLGADARTTACVHFGSYTLSTHKKQQQYQEGESPKACTYSFQKIRLTYDVKLDWNVTKPDTEL